MSIDKASASPNCINITIMCELALPQLLLYNKFWHNSQNAQKCMHTTLSMAA